MKKFEVFGASRATRQRHFKPEEEWLWRGEWQLGECLTAGLIHVWPRHQTREKFGHQECLIVFGHQTFYI